MPEMSAVARPCRGGAGGVGGGGPPTPGRTPKERSRKPNQSAISIRCGHAPRPSR
ncbi:hypothetical protein [Sphingopyxis sp. PET50]|uniref:hypothetical protein n=1 Tax=Sphingopyxis sp. PET50 TaxID=2976533 RepID=UPI0021AFFFFD|nr:hypothetical protein [Sphingopyxis sp. PET50]